jgi:flagellar secretion chaperone FliS
MNRTAAARAAYAESAALTASPGQLIVMLYDGAIRFLYAAAAASRQGNRSVARERLRRAQAIIAELNQTLDMSQGQIAHNLRSIYTFSTRHLIDSTLNGNPDGYEQVAKLLQELRVGWARAASVEPVPA